MLRFPRVRRAFCLDDDYGYEMDEVLISPHATPLLSLVQAALPVTLSLTVSYRLGRYAVCSSNHMNYIHVFRDSEELPCFSILVVRDAYLTLDFVVKHLYVYETTDDYCEYLSHISALTFTPLHCNLCEVRSVTIPDGDSRSLDFPAHIFRGAYYLLDTPIGFQDHGVVQFATPGDKQE